MAARCSGFASTRSRLFISSLHARDRVRLGQPGVDLAHDRAATAPALALLLDRVGERDRVRDNRERLARRAVETRALRRLALF